MNAPNQREEAIFEAAMALPADKRIAYLDQACGEDVQLRGQMKALLEAHEQTGGVLEEAPTPLRKSMVEFASPVVEKPGDRIGRYKLVQQIGEGGCGVVYMAEQQEPVKRLVALKVIKPGMDTRQVLARFDAERQALALMDHPNIAKVLDAGATETGRPFFVMELVRGRKITDYCDDPLNALPTPSRLELFIQVCRAIQHAHQKGIIHRDIKPSNVLVTAQEDGSPMPKVIDFGIAKATAGQTLIDKTVFTCFEQFIGTPAYMSPEQAAMAAQDIDTRSDIYSLGVLLYELLTGQTPFDSKRLLEAGVDEIRRIIREEEPPCPSSRLTTLAVQERNAHATRRRSDPPRLIRMMRGELDWIVMKCLEKDRTRRYETAIGLARDIERHMENQPIVAGPPSRLYRLGKLIRRHKLGFAAATAVGVSLGIALLALGFWISDKASTAEKEKRDQARVAQNEGRLRKQAQLEARRAEDAATEAKLTLAASDLAQAVRLIAEHQGADALAYLARSLALNPQGEAAATEMVTCLTRHSWPLPIACFQFSNSISGAYFGPDGTLIVVFGSDKTAWVWEPQTGKLLTDSLRHDAEIRGAEFSPDGNSILTISDDHTARVWDARTGRPMSAPLNHADRVNFAQFSPDGAWVVTASRDKTAQLWDWRNSRPVGEAMKHDGEVRWAEFSPDGRQVVTASDDSTARLWDTRTGTMTGQAMRHATRVVSARFSPDGRRVVTACPEGSARVWNARTGEPLTSPFTNTHGVWSARFSPDGKSIITTSWGKMACLWNAENGKQVLAPMEHNEFVESAQFDSAGRRIITGSRDGSARVWDAETARLVGEPIRHPDGVVSAQFSPDGQRALVASRDGTVCIWDIRSGQLLARPLRHGVGEAQVDFDPDGTGTKRMNAFLLAPNFAQFSPDSKRVLTASADNTARIWNSDTGELLAESPRHAGAVSSARFSRDGARVVTASRDNTARVWDARTGDPLLPPLRHDGWVLSAQFSPDGKQVLTASQDGTARIWDAQTGSAVLSPLKHRSGVLSAEFGSDGTRIVTASWDGTARVWNAVTSEQATEPLRHSSWVWSARFSSDGRSIVTASEDQTARVWDARTGSPMTAPLKHGTAVYSADFSPDGKWIVTASAAGEARVWDASTGHLMMQPFKHADIVYSARFSPDGKWIVTASWDGTARLWDTATGQPLMENLKHNHPVWLAEFSADGQRILTASVDGWARIWDIAPARGKHPDWLAHIAAAVSGRALNNRGVLEPITSNRADILKEIRQELAQPQDVDDWITWGRWLLADRSTRTASPFSTNTITDYIEKRVKIDTAQSQADLQQWAAGDAELSRRISLAAQALQPAIVGATLIGLLGSNGVAQARAGQWANAIVSFSRLMELEPDNYENFHSLAALLVQSGDTEAYRRHCDMVLARFGTTLDPVTAERMAKDCLILPCSGDVAALARLADTAVALGTNHTYFVFFQFAKGLAEYRQEHFAAAADWMSRVLRAGGSPSRQAEAHVVLAMAQYRLQDPERARASLSAGAEMIRQLPKLESGDIGAGWIDWIIAHALMREAKSLIEASREPRQLSP